MEDIQEFIWILLAIAIWVIQAVAKAMKVRQETAELRIPDPAPLPAPAPGPAPAPAPVPFPTPVLRATADETFRKNLLQGLAEVGAQAAALAGRIRLERPNRRFLPVLETFVPSESARLRAAALDSADRRLVAALDMLATVVNEIDELSRQRRDPVLASELGDTDTLADACYRPIVTFCQAEGLPLTTAWPATQLAEFDLAIWTGFIPTQVAPIFLPPEFFQRAAWWPAIAHEIGHDFLASVQGLHARTRQDLGLPSEEVGTRPLGFGPQGLSTAELERIFGGWFEELFCDVFSTMMCGPAYLATMAELFAAREDAREILLVELDGSGRRYDVHPPRHLRFLAGCQVLERMGFHADVKRLATAWEERHTTPDGRLPDRLLFPMGGQLLAVPLEMFTPTLERIALRIVAGPLSGLSQMGLEDVPGLDYGPHEHNEAERAASALLLGQVPTVRDPRAVIAGAVLATLEEPSLEPHVLRYAREAIPAMGTSERRHDAYDPALATQAGPGIDPTILRDAVVLREILQKR